MNAVSWWCGLAALSLAVGGALAVEPVAPAPATMQVVQYSAYGDADVLQLAERPLPQPQAGQIRLRVHAAGVNPIDWKLRAGRRGGALDGPVIPGFDVAGVVDAVGAGVDQPKVGDRIFALLDRSGGYAEYALVERGEWARIPDGVSFVEAAALPTAAYTAWRSLVPYGGLSAGQTVLVQAAPGGVGHYAVQIAHALGARVIGTGSAANEAFVRALGAEQYIDYRSQRFEAVVDEVDLVLDAVGGDTLARSYGVVRKGGTLVTIVGRADPGLIRQHGIRDGVRQPYAPGDSTPGQTLERLAGLMVKGQLRSEIQATFPLARAADAQRQSETGHARGKLVLVME